MAEPTVIVAIAQLLPHPTPDATDSSLVAGGGSSDWQELIGNARRKLSAVVLQWAGNDVDEPTLPEQSGHPPYPPDLVHAPSGREPRRS